MPHTPLWYQAILFEVEGVLADTARLRRSALEHALAAEALQLPADELHAAAYGRSAAAAAGELRSRVPGLDETILDLVALRAEREFDASLAGGLSLAPGVRGFMEGLAGRARLGIVTRLPRRQAKTIIELAELEAMFEVIVTSEDAAAKPSPAAYEQAMARMTRRAPLQRERVLALEDSADGITAAIAAGVRCIAVGSLPAHEALEATGFVPSLAGVTVSELARVAMGRDAEDER